MKPWLIVVISVVGTLVLVGVGLGIYAASVSSNADHDRAWKRCISSGLVTLGVDPGDENYIDMAAIVADTCNELDDEGRLVEVYG